MFVLMIEGYYRVIKGLSNKDKTSIGLFYKKVGKSPKYSLVILDVSETLF